MKHFSYKYSYISLNVTVFKACTIQDGQEIVIGESTNNLWTFSEELDTVVVTYVGGPSTVT